MAASSIASRVKELLARGVRLVDPAAVYVADEVAASRIAPDVVIHPGCRLRGAQTSIGPGSELGEEGPVTLEDCQLGSGVALKGGFFSGAVFLDGAGVGSGAHIRPGTLLEEEANAAHSVGFKQTLLMPFVTTGSLVNFCDCLMAGGTSRKHHSEVGSSYVHFNFTPHQDKATPSLIGDVPRGVMLNQAPIFLGGQGGLVGPSRIGFGCLIPAGVVWRRDAPGDHLILHPPPEPPRGPRTYHAGAYRDAARIFHNNLVYLGNVRALREWYVHARAPFMKGLYARYCHEGALRQLDAVLEERRRRLEEFVGKMARSVELLRADGGEAARRDAVWQERLAAAWPRVAETLDRGIGGAGLRDRDAFLAVLHPNADQPYLKALGGLAAPVRARGTAWLQAVVDVTAEAGRRVEGG